MIHLKMFSAPWCGPCKTMDEPLKVIAERGVLVAKIDIDANPTVAAIHNVRGVPTFKLYDDDKLVRTHTGAMSLGQLETFIKP